MHSLFERIYSLIGSFFSELIYDLNVAQDYSNLAASHAWLYRTQKQQSTITKVGNSKKNRGVSDTAKGQLKSTSGILL